MNSISQDKVLISQTNSTNTLLGANETFTGESQNVTGFTQVNVNYTTDVMSATDGVDLEFSQDGTTWVKKNTHTSPSNPISGKYGKNYTSWVVGKYFRMVYTNGSEAQTFFQVQVSFRVFRDPELLTTSLSVIDSNQSSQAVRLASEYKRDVAMGLVGFSSNFIVNGMRGDGVGDTEKILSTLSTDTYPWPQTARKLRIKAGGNVNDTFGGSGANFVTVVGLDSDWNQYYETIMTTGALASSWTTNTFIRVNTVVVSVAGAYSGSNEGAVVIESETDLSELAVVCPGHSRSLMSNYTVPKGYSCVIPRVSFMVDSEHSATITGWYRANNLSVSPPHSPSMIINYVPGLKGTFESKPEELIAFSELTDFWVTAMKFSGTGNAHVTVAFDIDLLMKQ